MIEDYYKRLISNAERALQSSQSEWTKEYWLEVITKLAQNVDKN